MSEQLTVAQLISVLQDLPQDAKVLVPFAETSDKEPCGDAGLLEDGSVMIYGW